MVGQFLIYALVYLEPSGQSCRDPRLFFIAAVPIAPPYAVKLCFATSRSCRDTLQWPLGRQAGRLILLRVAGMQSASWIPGALTINHY